MWEEVDFDTAAEGGGRGRNYGWAACEASYTYPEQTPPQPCLLPGATNPVYEYSHGDRARSQVGTSARDPGDP